MIRRALSASLSALAILVLAGCATTHGPSKPKDVEVEKAFWHHAEDLVYEKSLRDDHYVIIYGPDSIAFPSTPINGPKLDAKYTYHIWVDDKAGASPMELIKTGQLQIEVFGVTDYHLEQVVNRFESGLPGAATTNEETAPDTFRHVVDSRPARTVNLVIEPKNITGDIMVMAWMPGPFRRHQEGLDRDAQNPWIYRKEIKTYDGDLQTNLVMLSHDEVELQFGKHFAKYFFVGRVNVHNANDEQDQKLLVYTTTMRPLVYFYTEPDKRMAKVLSGRDLDKRLDLIRARGNRTSSGITRAEYDILFENTLRAMEEEEPDDIVTGSGFSRSYNEQRFNEAVDIVLGIRTKAKPLIATAAYELEETLNPSPSTGDVANTESQLITVLNSSQLPEVLAGHSSAFRDGGVAQWVDRSFDRGEFRQIFQVLVDELQVTREQVWTAFCLSPLNFPRAIPTGLNGEPLAFSDDTLRQARLNEHGYIWKGYYRPMSFQAVLNALIEITEQSPEHTVMRWLESAGVVAGGLIGVGSIANEVTKPQYTEAVAVITAIILPEMRKLILFDLKKYIRNLGELGMDTILEVEAHDYVEKYVFFPRGPIFNEADELGVGKASYIVKVDARDMAVDAELVKLKRDFSTGGSLVARAISEEETNRQMALDLNDQMRRFALESLRARYEALKKAGKMDDADEAIAEFERIYGQDPSGTIDTMKAESVSLEIKGLPTNSEADPLVITHGKDPKILPFSVKRSVESEDTIEFFHRVTGGEGSVFKVRYAESETVSSSRAIIIESAITQKTPDAANYPNRTAEITIYAMSGALVTKHVIHVKLALN